MKKNLIFLAMIFLFPSAVSWAETTTVPHFLAYESLLYDDGGNLLEDGPADIIFKITDSAGTVLYEEHQRVDVANGAVSVIVGNGLDASGAPLNGVPSTIFDSSDGRYLDVSFDGYPPYTGLEIVSVPYALYAESALTVKAGGVNGEAIADKSITMDHLADGMLEELAGALSGTGGTITTRTDLTNLQTTYRSITGARSIGVAQGFVNSGSTDVQHVLQDLDRAIQHGAAVTRIAQTGISDEAAARAAADAAHADATTGVHGVTGNVVGTTDAQTLTNKTIIGATISDSTINNPTINGGTIDGTTISGVSVEATLDEHEERIEMLEDGREVSPKVSVWGSIGTGSKIVCAAPARTVPTVLFGNVTVEAIEEECVLTGVTRITFRAPLANTNYAVTITPSSLEIGPCNPQAVFNKTINSFDVLGPHTVGAERCPAYNFDFMVVDQNP